MNNYLNFFNPPTISVLFCLYQLCNRNSQLDANNKIVDFVIQKIMKLNQQWTCTTNQQFQAQLFSLTDDTFFLNQYRASVESITCLNDFYRFLSKTLKSLRMIKNNKNQQGNIIDLFLRRLILYFSKFDFKQLVSIYEEFNKYKNNQQIKSQFNEFTVSRKLQQIKFNIQNYSQHIGYQQINQKLTQLQQFDHNFKVYYLKALNQANGKKPITSTDNIHKYFDKSLGNLFQQKNQSSLQNNNVNHCILSLAYMNLKLGFIDQSLKSISEGLRISQNNSDAESINHCIIYLYQIAGYLGKYIQQTLLTEHAITHSLNLNNILLMLFSCLNYSEIQKYYDCSNKQLDIVSSRNLKWTDALHYSKKKIYSNFQNSCKNLFHSQRNLGIPNFLHKLALLIHLPHLKDLFLVSLKNKAQLIKLDKYKLFLCENKLDQMMESTLISFNRCQNNRANKQISELNELSKYLTQPKYIIKIWAFKNILLIRDNKLLQGYSSVQRLITFCKQKGFVKQHLNEQLINLANIYYLSKNYMESLTIIEQIKVNSKQYNLQQHKFISRLYKAKIHAKLGYISYPLQLIKKLEQLGQLQNVSKSIVSQYQQVKINLFQNILSVISKNNDLKQQELDLQLQIQSLYQHCIKIELQLLNFQRVRHLLNMRLQFLKDNKLKLTMQKKIAQVIDYLGSTFIYFKRLVADYDNQNIKVLSQKIKIRISIKLK